MDRVSVEWNSFCLSFLFLKNSPKIQELSKMLLLSHFDAFIRQDAWYILFVYDANVSENI